MKVVIFGGSGFIGSHLSSYLLNFGFEVTVFSRKTPTETISGVTYYSGDIMNVKEVDDVVGGKDFVINLASTVIPQTSNNDPIYDVQSNLVGALHILNSCVKYSIKKVVFSSSGGTVYGGVCPSEGFSEENTTSPICSYGIVKLAIEKYLNMYHVLYGLKYSALRISNPYGPGQLGSNKPLGAISIFLKKAKALQPIEIWGDGTIRRDFIYIDDLISAIYKTLISENANGVYNVGAGVSFSLNDVLNEISGVVGYRPDVRYFDNRSFDVHDTKLNIDRIKSEVNWSPLTCLSSGIKFLFEKT